MTGAGDSETRERARDRSEAYRGRRRHGRILVSVEIESHQLAALERLALLEVGNRDKKAVAAAVQRFLEAAPHISAVGDALGPAKPPFDRANSLHCARQSGR
jgi:hypothetical protein